MSANASNELRPPRTSFQGFKILWDDVTQEFNTRKTYWPAIRTGDNVDALQVLFSWVHRSHNGRLSYIGERFKDIYYSRLDVGEDADWYFMYPLGRGGFGVVAMFEKKDLISGRPVDQVAVKTARSRQSEAVDPGRRELSKEAALMAQLADLHKDGTVALRCFKAYPVDRSWKYYLEYCPYGNLDRLMLRYKGYGRYLPEAFLWHVFYWLAKTIHEFTDTNKWCDMTNDSWGQIINKGFLLHCDIKPQNILLGPPDPSDPSPVNLYPIPRITDFGLGDIESPDSHLNTAANLDKGTHTWKPPEVRYTSMNQDTSFYPFAAILSSDINDKYRKGYHSITSKANIWAIGAVMYQMVTLNEGEVLSDKVDDILCENEPWGPALTNDDFQILQPQHYSVELRDLIIACTSIRPHDRPEEHEVLTLCEHHYSLALFGIRNQGFGTPGGPSVADAIAHHPNYKVYFRGNEIDNAPDNDQFDHPGRDLEWWSDCFVPEFAWMDARWGRLYPAAMPTDVVAPSTWPDAWKSELQHLKDQVRAERPPPPLPSEHNPPLAAQTVIHTLSSIDREILRLVDSPELNQFPATQQQNHQQQQQQQQLDVPATPPQQIPTVSSIERAIHALQPSSSPLAAAPATALYPRPNIHQQAQQAFNVAQHLILQDQSLFGGGDGVAASQPSTQVLNPAQDQFGRPLDRVGGNAGAPAVHGGQSSPVAQSGPIRTVRSVRRAVPYNASHRPRRQG